MVAAVALLFFTLTRVILLLYTGHENVPFSNFLMIFGRGLLFDTATLAYILPPFLLLDAMFPRKFFRSVLLPVIYVLGFLGVAEITFWMEFHTRFNFIALDYLIYTNEVLRNIWQSYPLVWILIGLALLAGWLTFYLSKRFTNGLAPSPQARWASVLLAVLLPLMSAKFVRVEQMYRQGNVYAEELAGNGLFTLSAAARHNELDYERFYATLPQPEADKILAGLGVEWREDLAHRRNQWGDDKGEHPVPSFFKKRPRHLVLISVESLSASFVGAYGSTKGLTPHLDRLAQKSVLFRHVFATGTRTVRGLEALSLATPPIPGQAIIRRPRNAHLASMGEMLKYQGFDSQFFYGGYGYFDNMNAFFAANDYAVFDRPTIPKGLIVFENAWGVADEVLFEHAIQEMDRVDTKRKRIFAHIMTTSNHRPYTYPQGRIDIPSPGGREGAVKYTDYALGKFIEDARKKPWFKDTLFVIVADHCASVAGKTVLPVADYRIPLLFYGPELLKPAIVDRMISQIDIPPTLFDLLDVAGDDRFFGKELPEQKGAARAFISNYQNLGYYKNDQLIVLKPRRIIEAYRVNPVTYESTLMSPDPVLVKEAIAYYQTASRAYKLDQLKLLWK